MNTTARPSVQGLSVRTGAAMLLLASLCGCALMQHEDKSSIAPLPPQKIDLAPDIRLARDGWPQARWWRRYGDSQLDALVERALEQAPSMTVARERVEAGRAQARLVESSTEAMVGLSATLDRQSVSSNGFLGPYGQTIPALGTKGPWYTAGTIGLAGEYSFDIWGKDRARVNAAIGLSQARLAEAAQTELLLSTQIVHMYSDIQTQYALQALLEQARDIERETVVAHQAKAARGLEPRTPGELAQAHQLAMERQITATQTRIRKLREALRALLGASGQDTVEIKPHALPAASAQLPASLGYELLAHRPDLQAMRWTVQASLDQVDAAKAAFYPSFDIRGFAGFDALHLDELLHRSSRQFNLVPGLTLPIFDSGRLNANLSHARSQNRLLVAEYNQAILSAVREVAQASIELEGLQQQAMLQQGQLAAAKFALGSAEAHYQTGLADRVTAQEARLPVLKEQGLALALQSQQIHTQIALTAALGGGYEAAEPRPAARATASRPEARIKSNCRCQHFWHGT